MEGATVGGKAMPQRFVALVFDDLHMKAAEALAVHGEYDRCKCAVHCRPVAGYRCAIPTAAR
jgi:hypothetical protein